MLKFRNVMICAMAIGIAGTVTQPAAAANLTHAYELNGNFSDAFGAPDLLPSGGVIGSTGYTFAPNQGLAMKDAINATSYSIELLFKFDATNGLQKIIDFQNFTAVGGLYTHDTFLDYFAGAYGPAGAISPNTLMHVVMTRDSADTVHAYVNGVQQIQFTDSPGTAIINGPNHIVNFFEDDLFNQQSEAASGFVDFIHIYDAPLTGSEVADLYRNLPVQSSVPEPSQAGAFAIGILVLSGLMISRRRTMACRSVS